MHIIKTKPSDWKKIKDGIKFVELHSFEKSLRYEEDDGDYESFLMRNTINYIIKDSGKIVGYLMSCPIENDTRYRRDKHFGKQITIHLESIAIIPEYRGSGMGKKVFERWLKEAKREGYERSVMDATSRSMVHLALKFGFVKVKHFKKWEGSRSSWFMEKWFYNTSK